MSTTHKIGVLVAITICLTVLTCLSGVAQAIVLPGTLKSHQKISDTQGHLPARWIMMTTFADQSHPSGILMETG